MTNLTALSLFSGAGGMDVGVKKAGFSVIVANEIDSSACNTYRNNHPESRMIEGNIHTCMDQITQYKDIDLIFGGPPCQGFSIAGIMAPNDPRSQMVFSFCEVVERINPASFIMENVPHLNESFHFKDIKLNFTQRFERAGYSITAITLNAKEFGVPQSRKRVFFMGMKKGYPHIEASDFDCFKCPAVSVKDTIGHLGKAGTVTNPSFNKAQLIWAKKSYPGKSIYTGTFFNGFGKLINPEGQCNTVTAAGGNTTHFIDEGHFYDNQAPWLEKYREELVNRKKTLKRGDILYVRSSVVPNEVSSRIRRLTNKEAALIQSFPEDYRFSGNNREIYTQIGNAVPCKLAEVVALVMKKHLEKGIADRRADEYTASDFMYFIKTVQTSGSKRPKPLDDHQDEVDEHQDKRPNQRA